MDETPILKEKEARLRSENRLRLVLKSSELGYMDWNLVTKRFICSEEVFHSLGYENTPYSNGNFDTERDIDSWFELILPQRKNQVITTLNQSMENSDDLFSLEFPMKNAKEEWQWIHLSGKVVERSPEGMPLRFLGTLWDATEEKKKDLKLQRIHLRKEALLNMHKNSSNLDFPLFDQSLRTVVKTTQSLFGFIFLYSEDTHIFTLDTWSRAVLDKQSLLNMEQTGLWRDVVRQRNSVIMNKVTTEATGSLSSFLAIPIFDHHKIVAVTGVANKEDAYTQDDVEDLTILLEEVWTIHLR